MGRGNERGGKEQAFDGQGMVHDGGRLVGVGPGLGLDLANAAGKIPIRTATMAGLRAPGSPPFRYQ
jgi:hypothetical protein